MVIHLQSALPKGLFSPQHIFAYILWVHCSNTHIHTNRLLLQINALRHELRNLGKCKANTRITLYIYIANTKHLYHVAILLMAAMLMERGFIDLSPFRFSYLICFFIVQLIFAFKQSIVKRQYAYLNLNTIRVIYFNEKNVKYV